MYIRRWFMLPSASHLSQKTAKTPKKILYWPFKWDKWIALRTATPEELKRTNVQAIRSKIQIKLI